MSDKIESQYDTSGMEDITQYIDVIQREVSPPMGVLRYFMGVAGLNFRLFGARRALSNIL